MRTASRLPIATKPYWVLLSRNGAAAPWGVQFGDYVRNVVAAEYSDWRSHGHLASDLKIIRVSMDVQEEIDKRVAALNAEEK